MRFMYKQYLFWLGLSVIVSLGFQFILPFPFGIIAALSFFIMLPLILRTTTFRRLLHMEDFYDNIKTNFVCTICNTKHRRPICPRCGSNMKRPTYDNE